MDEAFEEYVRARQGRLLAYAVRLSGSQATAEDLVQEALLRTGVRWGRIERRDNPDAYVYAAITNIYLTARRKGLREVVTDRSTERPERAVDREAAMDLRAAMTQLSRQQRAVLLLRYYADLSEAQIAAHLNISRGTVKSTASDGLRRLGQLTGNVRPVG